MSDRDQGQRDYHLDHAVEAARVRRDKRQAEKTREAEDKAREAEARHRRNLAALLPYTVEREDPDDHGCVW